MLNKQVEFATAPISLAHTYGNMTAYITEMIRKHFAENYFKTITVSSKIAYRYFNIFDNTNKEFIKKNKPFLIVRPRVEVGNQEGFLSGTYLTTRMFNGYDGTDYGNLIPFFLDEEKKIESRFLLNRFRMYFDVSIIVESQMEQLNIAKYLENTLANDRPRYLNCALESQIPATIMKSIADINAIDINDTSKMLQYMNAHSMYPVTFKMKNSTGNDEFFRYYPVNVDCTIGELSIDDGTRKGFVDDSYAINFRVSTEFNGAGLYYLYSVNKEHKRILLHNSTSIVDLDDSSLIDMMFTEVDLFGETMPEGWELYSAPMYKVERTDKPDKMNFSDLLNTSILESIKFHVEKSIPLEKLIKVKVLKDSDVLEEGKDYTLNFDKSTITTFKLNKLSTYRIVIYINVFYVNELAIELLNREEK